MLYSALAEFPMIAIASIGFYISLRILKFPDLSSDASSMIGMSGVAVVSGKFYGSDVFIGLFLSIILGSLVGAITGVLHTSKQFKMNKFLAGLIVSFGIYSVAFRLCGKTASLSLFDKREQMMVPSWLSSFSGSIQVIILLCFTTLVWLSVSRLMHSRLGYTLRVAGHQPDILKVSGVSSNLFIILGLMLSGSLISLAGWLDATTNTNVSLSPFGLVITLLASCLLGDFFRYILVNIFGNRNNVNKRGIYILMLSPILGALIFCFLRASVIKVLSGEFKVMVTTDIQLVIALCILLVSFLGKKFDNFGEEEEEI